MNNVVSSVQWSSADDGAKHPTRQFIAEADTGRKRTGALWLPDSAASSSLVAFGHGASGNRYQAPIPYLAGKFVKAGHTVVSIDGPVHGLRQVGPGGRKAFGEEMRRESMIDDMNEDWRFAIELAQSESGTELSQMAYFGLSMGSIFGIPMLADSTRGLPVVVATLGLLGSQGVGNRLSTRILEDAAKLSFPILFLMQLEDELFSREGYLELFDALASSDKRIHANPGLHPEVPGEEMRFAFDFMLKHLE
ncbi:MAG: hypothetical protein OXG15_10545 [Gammaproteobacteria bacterium]|nr:hypothetical protein [Gammaproteobacteria bacterium]